MNTNIRCLLKACGNASITAQNLHPAGNLVRVEIGDPPLIFANWSTPINRHASARICNDKEYSYLLLKDHVRTPKTLGFIDPGVQEEYRSYVSHADHDSILATLSEEFGYPLILKRNAGSCGSNVFRCDHEAQAHAALDVIFNKQARQYDYVALAQELVRIRHEYRALFLDGELIFFYEKDVSGATFTGNLSPLHWENARAVLIRDEEIFAAVQTFAQPIFRALPLRFAGLDLALDEAGEWWLLEANSAPAFDIYVRHNGEEEVVELYRRMLEKLSFEA